MGVFAISENDRDSIQKSPRKNASRWPIAKRIEATIIQHVSDQLQKGELRKVLVERVDSILLNDASQRAEREQRAGEEPFTD